jgi:hypothetical protein
MPTKCGRISNVLAQTQKGNTGVFLRPVRVGRSTLVSVQQWSLRGAGRSMSPAPPPPGCYHVPRVRALELQPPERRPAHVRRLLVLPDQALVVLREDLTPGFDAVVAQPAGGEDLARPLDGLLERDAPIPQRLPPDVAFPPEAVKRHENRRRGEVDRFPTVEPVKTRLEVLVEDRDLAVKDELVIAEGVDLGRELGESLGVISPGSADELDLVAVFVSNHSPPVVLLFVDPARRMELTGDLGPMHQQEGGSLGSID